MKRTSGKRWISLVLALCLCLLVGCGGKQTGYDPLKGVETRMITDSAGRQVEIPAEITRIAPSGSTAQMILMPVAYDLLVGLSSSPSTAHNTNKAPQRAYSIFFDMDKSPYGFSLFYPGLGKKARELHICAGTKIFWTGV